MKIINKMYFIDVLIMCCILLLIVISVAGAFSFSTTKAYDVLNQYGDTVKIYGEGMYWNCTFRGVVAGYYLVTD